MKELSIEEKARLYDEALKEAVIAHKDEDRHLKATLERIFPTLKESEDEKARKGLIGHLKECRNQCRSEVMIREYAKWIAWLEKQGEQESVAKVTPKYKVGDWLQYRNAKPFFVEEITKQGYVNGDSCLPFNWENEIHLWTISDARDGDALVHNGCTFIFMGIKDGIVQAIEENLLEPISFGEIDKDTDYHPATKEQRDLLFSKMREAGFEWDSEKKELRKIEQKPVEWNEKDMGYIDDLIAHFSQNEKLENTKEDIIVWLKSLKNRYTSQLNKEWSEEDEKVFSIISDLLWKGYKSSINEKLPAWDEIREWLLSIKNRIQSQPRQGWSEDDKNILDRTIYIKYD